jgi:DnaK suppressor protein
MAEARRIQENSGEQTQQDLKDFYPEFTQRLNTRQDEIISRANVARSNLDEQVITSPGDAADESVIDTSADYFLRLANNHQRELVEIRDAIDRMHRGVYGVCESCENPVAIERLRRLPYARFCVDCQSRFEKRNPLRAVSHKI